MVAISVVEASECCMVLYHWIPVPAVPYSIVQYWYLHVVAVSVVETSECCSLSLDPCTYSIVQYRYLHVVAISVVETSECCMVLYHGLGHVTGS